MPNDKGTFYVQARSGNVICGEFGMYCTTAMGSGNFGYSSENNLFSSKGTGYSSDFELMDVWDEEHCTDLTMEVHSGFSGEYFGLLLLELGTSNKTSVQQHKAAILMKELDTGNNVRWIGFGFVANPTDATNIAICGASKYYYEDETGSAGYRQLFVGLDYITSNDNGSPEMPAKKYYEFRGRSGDCL